MIGSVVEFCIIVVSFSCTVLVCVHSCLCQKSMMFVMGVMIVMKFKVC